MAWVGGLCVCCRVLCFGRIAFTDWCPLPAPGSAASRYFRGMGSRVGPRDSSNKTDSSSSKNEASRSKGHEVFYNWMSEEGLGTRPLGLCVKIRARVSRRAKQASRSKTGSNGLEQKSAFPWSFGTVFCPISVNPNDERVFTREAGKKLYQRTKGKPCKNSFADELSAIEVSGQ